MSKTARSLAFFIFSGISIIGVLPGSTAQAGDNGHPALNAIGRFWGVGYSQRGYQVAPGPLNVVRKMHPASAYGSTALLAPYHQASYPQAYSPPSPVLSYPTQPQALADTNAEVVPAPKPVGPPPTWLEPYLNEKASKPAKPEGESIIIESIDSEPSIDTEPNGELSPSDKTADDLLLDFSSASRVFAPARTVNRYR